MSEAVKDNTAGFQIQVAPSRLLAQVLIEPGSKVTAGELIAALREMKLRDFDDGAVMEALQSPIESPVSIDVAKGIPAVDEIPAKVQFRVPLSEGPGVGLTRVQAQQVVATLGTSTPGKDGLDVFGEGIPHNRAATQFELGEGLTLVKGELTTTIKGNLLLSGGILSVKPLLDVYSDDGKPVDFNGDVAIKGGLRDGQIVRASGCVVVGGAVEAANLTVGGSLQVKGGMIGKNTGRCIVEGDVHCRFISGMVIAARGTVNVQGEVVHSRIKCGGALMASRGTIYGGEIVAAGGVTCHSLGNERGTPTLIEAGTDRAQLELALTEAREIEVSQKRVREIREKIEPLMKLLKSLTPQQREKVTELMAEAGDLEDAAVEKARKIDERCKAMRQSTCAEVQVAEAAYAGVTVRFPGVEVVLSSALKGPFKLMPRKQSALTEIVLVDQTTGTVSVLPSHQVLEAGVSSVEKIAHRKCA